ncbi:MAG TPA: VWA domain-containing protein [Syntrophales bacterium]|nr:VWA domain-containing protein [Syntrophales bacterium]HOL59520.1 VWA domain-containing protein [Syntrophales bacterium]HPO35610.1 VWA domain-containing protein [Syntrophales bacterium]
MMKGIDILPGMVGQKRAKLALLLLAINPHCGGVVFSGPVGTGKSLIAQLLRDLLPTEVPFVKIPLHVTEEAMWGGLDFERSLKTGKALLTKGILERAIGGIVLVDDINLLSPSALYGLLRHLDEGAISLVATANPLAGPVPSAIWERMGFYVLLEEFEDEPNRAEVIRFNLGRNVSEDGKARLLVAQARQRLKEMEVPEEVIKAIACRVLAHGITSHRRDIYLLEAAKAYAALWGENKVLEAHVEAVKSLVLFSEPPPAFLTPPDPPPAASESTKGTHAHDALPPGPRQGRSKDEVFEVGATFEVRRLFFPMDRLRRSSDGRRTPTQAKKQGGRQVGVTLTGKKDIALSATVRAAAPYQTRRGRTTSLIIKDEDLRFWRRAKKTGHLVIFVTDASGSMGVNRRMAATKGAIMSLLMDCYKYRDRVAMVAFRGEKASVLLPPTSSVTLAARRLREMPVGGKTPLNAGLISAYEMVVAQARRMPEMRFVIVLVTDGRANVSISKEPVMSEFVKLAEKMRKLPRTDFLVVDTEDKSSLLKTDRAKKVAALLGAKYFVMEELGAKKIADIVRGIGT